MRSATYASDRWRRPRWRRVAVWCLAFVPLAAYLALHALASLKLRDEERAWAAAFGPMSELASRYPLRHQTPAAARLATLAAGLVETRLDTPGRNALFEVMQEQPRRASNQLVALPQAAVQFLEQNQHTLDDIESILLGPEPVALERGPLRVDASSFPTAQFSVAHRSLLGRALKAAVAGDTPAASRALRAVGRYRRAVCDELDQSAFWGCSYSGAGLNAVARSVASAPAEWNACVDVPQASAVDIHRVRAASWLLTARASVFSARSILDRAGRGRSLWPWVRDVVAAPWIRLEIGVTSFALRRQLLEARKRRCPDRPPAPLPPPPLVPELAEFFDAGGDLQMEVASRFDDERTRLVLEALAFRSQTGAWPAATDTPSGVCNGTVWTLRLAPDDRLVVEPSRVPGGLPNAGGRWTYTVSAPAVGAR
jgi:hypothetical protein